MNTFTGKPALFSPPPVRFRLFRTTGSAGTVGQRRHGRSMVSDGVKVRASSSHDEPREQAVPGAEPFYPARRRGVRIDIVPGKFYAERLQDLRVCPAGQFPMRFGDGKDLRPGETCTPFKARLGWWNWKAIAGPEDDLRIAGSLAGTLAEVQPCPYSQDWQAAPDMDETPPDFSIPSKRPSSFEIPDRTGHEPEMTTAGSVSSACDETTNSTGKSTGYYRSASVRFELR